MKILTKALDVSAAVPHITSPPGEGGSMCQWFLTCDDSLTRVPGREVLNRPQSALSAQLKR